MADDTGGLTPVAGGPSPEELSRFPLNDIGNGLRLIRLAGGTVDPDGHVELDAARLLYLREAGWIGFNGQYWDLKGGERMAQRLAHKVAAGLFDQMQVLASNPDAKLSAKDKQDLYDWAESCGNAGRTSSMLRQAQAYMEVDLDAFDQDPLALAVANGTLKWRRTRGGAQLAFVARHDPADRITRMMDAGYDPKAACPTFDEAMATWQPTEATRVYLQTALGYGLTGDTSEQAFFILQGKGNDGKSTLMNLVRKMSDGYAATADVKSFLDQGQRGGADASPDIARLAGDTRLVSTAEPPKNSKLADNMIKAFTGGGNMTARHLKQGLFEFEPVAKVFLECNGRPQPQGTDNGIWRRLKLIPFMHPIAADKVDKTLKSRLWAERSGVLNWLLEGTRRWLAEGLKEPADVVEFLADYRKGASSFGEWAADYLVLDAEAVTLSSVLYNSYKSFMEERDERAMSQTQFGKALGEMQVIRTSKDGAGKIRRKGGRLKTAQELRDEGTASQGNLGAGGRSDDRGSFPADDDEGGDE